MAKAISDEELQLKKRARRRLVGAIALVLVVVMFLPMFLADEPKPLNQDIAINIPPVPAEEPILQAVTPVAPPDTPPQATHSPPPQVVAGMPGGEVGREPVAGPAEQAPNSAIKPAQKPAARTAQTKKSAENDLYLVQLGAFSNAANAKTLQKKLQDNKFKAHTELVKAPGGDRTRVRVGPYPSRNAAEKARDRLKALKLIIGEATVVRQGD